MAGHVNETETHVAEIEKGESEINGDTSALFFFEAVGIRARQRFDERGLAMVNVTGGADDNVLGGFHQQDSMRWTMLADAWRWVKFGGARKRPTTRDGLLAASEKRVRYFESLSVRVHRWELLGGRPLLQQGE